MSNVEYKANCVLRTRVREGKAAIAVEIKPGDEVTEEALQDMGMSADEAKNFIADQVECGRIKEVGGNVEKPASAAAKKAEEDAAKEAAAKKAEEDAAKEAAAKKAEEDAANNANKGGGQQGGKK